MIYLDNAATSYPKPDRVYDEMLLCMKEYCANPGRSGHELAIKTGRAVYETREIVSRFFNIENPMRVVFTKNATEALNLAINGVLKEGDHVITTSMEHIRHGGHLPQDSSTVNSRKNFAMSTIHVSSSMIISPPEPIIEPNWVNES